MKRVKRVLSIMIIVIGITFIFKFNALASIRLSKPKSVAIEMRNNTQVRIKWKRVKKASKYQIYCATGSKYKRICTTKKISYLHKGLKEGKTYKYKIKALCGKKKSNFSKMIKVKTMGGATAKINASVKGAKVTLSWNKVKNADGYYVFRGEDGEFAKVSNVKAPIYKNNSGLDLSTKYNYKIIPYIVKGGKIVQGKGAIKTVMTGKSDYFLDIVSAYEKPYWYTIYGGNVFKMGGMNYRHGFTCMGYGGSDEGNQGNVTYFNLRGKYKKLSFDAGILDDEGWERNNASVYIYKDGVLGSAFEIKTDSLPKHYEIDITNCIQLKICVYSGRSVAFYDSTYGFGNMVISK